MLSLLQNILLAVCRDDMRSYASSTPMATGSHTLTFGGTPIEIEMQYLDTVDVQAKGTL